MMKYHPSNESGGDLSEVFQRIYDLREWGESPVSGGGSNDVNTINLRREFRSTLDSLGVRSLFDAPCGDWTWMSQIDLEGVNYHGADIVPCLVEQNRSRYERKGIRFSVHDITRPSFPKVDLILIRDCLVHLSNELVHKVIRYAQLSGSRYLAATFFPGAKNEDISNGYWRMLDLTRPPFQLRNLMCHIPENEAGKFLAFWELNPRKSRRSSLL